MKNPLEQDARNFIIINSSFGLMPLIETPTRITMNSETLIDNIFTNVVGSRIERGCFFADITDHLPIFMLTNIRLPKNIKIIPEKISRKISNEGINSAKYELNRLDWTPIIIFSCKYQ